MKTSELLNLDMEEYPVPFKRHLKNFRLVKNTP